VYETSSARQAKAIVASSGCANASTGEQGFADALEMSMLAAKVIGRETGRSPDWPIPASSELIYRCPQSEPQLKKLTVKPDGGHDFERAIMTTRYCSEGSCCYL